MELVKQDPPAPQQFIRGIKWDEVVDVLKNNPNDFFLVGEFSPGMASHLRSGKIKAMVPAGETDPEGYVSRHYEITARSIVKGGARVEIFMRYLP
jgi:hypothetical protein